MRQLMLRASLATAVGCLLACGQYSTSRDLFNQSDYSLTMRDRLRFEMQAPVIVSGRVVDVKEIGLPQLSSGDRRILVQLTRIRIAVEQKIKREAAGSEMEFDVFTYSNRNKGDLGVPRYIPMVGQRRIYFLKKVRGRYRSVGDVTNYNLPVRSGFHDKAICSGMSAGCCIAQVLLTPGQDVDVESFSTLLYEAEYAASVCCSRSGAVALVRQLLENPDSRITEAARGLLDALAQDAPH
jgi:hypothetical protein